MDTPGHLTVARTALGDLVAASRAAGPEASVPACPDWTVADLTTHVVGFLGMWCAALGVPGEAPADPADPDGAAATGNALLDHLAGRAPSDPVRFRNRTLTVGFVARRVAHELVIHAGDAAEVTGARPAVPPEVAVDGIAEIFDLIEAFDRLGRNRGTGETLHIHATDHPDGEWFVTFDGATVAERRHARADLALRGRASDLLAVLYGRTPGAEPDRFGDPSVLDLWREAFTF